MIAMFSPRCTNPSLMKPHYRGVHYIATLGSCMPTSTSHKQMDKVSVPDGFNDDYKSK